MMISKVRLVNTDVRAVSDDGFDVLVADQGTPLIEGNYLFANNKVSLVSPTGETLVFAVPFRQNDKVLVHFAFGTEERRVCHTVEIEGLEIIVQNLTTMLEWAKLEQMAGPDQNRRR